MVKLGDRLLIYLYSEDIGQAHDWTAFEQRAFGRLLCARGSETGWSGGLVVMCRPMIKRWDWSVI